MTQIGLKEGVKCPKCGSTLFHAEQTGKTLTLVCWKSGHTDKRCGYVLYSTVNPTELKPIEKVEADYEKERKRMKKR